MFIMKPMQYISYLDLNAVENQTLDGTHRRAHCHPTEKKLPYHPRLSRRYLPIAILCPLLRRSCLFPII